MQEFLHFIDGEYTRGTTGRTFDNVDPTNGGTFGIVHEGGEAEVDAAVTAARRALKGPWAKLTVAKRMELLHAVADRIDARFEEFLEAEMRDTGKPIGLASHIDIPRGAANFRIFADLFRNVPGETFLMDTPDGRGAVNYTVHAPKGVIGVICPWNLPLLLMTWKVGPALAAGNTVVVKPSEETPGTTTLLGSVMKEVGIPDGVFNVVHGLGPNSAGEHLTRHPGIDGITFTGETRTGAVIMKAAADRAVDVSLELGGKNPGIFFDDMDVDRAVSVAMRSCFGNCGQVCLGTERLYVHRNIFDEFVSKLAKGASELTMGPSRSGSTLGPLISQEHRDKVKGYYDLAKELGAEVLVGGGVPEMGAALDGGSWIQPTLWTGLSEDSRIVKEEIFGPCAHVQPFDDEDQVIAWANDTTYGLACSLHTNDLQRAHRVGQQIEAGLIWINDWFLRDLRTPFGGSKRSGIGREGGVHSLEFYTETRNLCVKL